MHHTGRVTERYVLALGYRGCPDQTDFRQPPKIPSTQQRGKIMPPGFDGAGLRARACKKTRRGRWGRRVPRDGIPVAGFVASAPAR